MHPCEDRKTPTDFGPHPFTVNINCAARENDCFRRALWTGCNLQTTLMSIPPCGEIGQEQKESACQNTPRQKFAECSAAKHPDHMRNRQSHKSDHSAAADHTCAQCRHGQHQQWFEPLHPHPRKLRRPISEKQHVQFRCKTEQNSPGTQPRRRKQDHIAPGDPPESPQQPEHQCREPFIGEIQRTGSQGGSKGIDRNPR